MANGKYRLVFRQKCISIFFKSIEQYTYAEYRFTTPPPFSHVCVFNPPKTFFYHHIVKRVVCMKVKFNLMFKATLNFVVISFPYSFCALKKRLREKRYPRVIVCLYVWILLALLFETTENQSLKFKPN